MTHLTENIYGIVMPEDAHGFNIEEHLFYKASFMGMENIGQMKKLPEGKWGILGILTSDITGFNCEPYVRWDYVRDGVKGYYDYIQEKILWTRPEDSFRSLIELHGHYFSNPIGAEPTLEDSSCLEDFICALSKWKSFEEKLINKLLVIEKL